MSREVYRVTFWMKHFGSSTAKRTCIWSTSKLITAFWWGVLTKKEAKKKTGKQQLKPVKQYFDKTGRKRFKGTLDLTKTGHLIFV